MAGILVFVEQRKGKIRAASLQAVSEARRLAAGPVSAVVAGSGIAADAASLGEYGASKVFVADDPNLALYSAEGYAEVVKQGVRVGPAGGDPVRRHRHGSRPGATGRRPPRGQRRRRRRGTHPRGRHPRGDAAGVLGQGDRNRRHRRQAAAGDQPASQRVRRRAGGRHGRGGRARRPRAVDPGGGQGAAGHRRRRARRGRGRHHRVRRPRHQGPGELRPDPRAGATPSAGRSAPRAPSSTPAGSSTSTRSGRPARW